MVRHSTRQRISSAPRTPLGEVELPFEARDLATGVTPKPKGQKAALVKMKLKELSEDLQQRELCFLTNTLSLTMK